MVPSNSELNFSSLIVQAKKDCEISDGVLIEAIERIINIFLDLEFSTNRLRGIGLPEICIISPGTLTMKFEQELSKEQFDFLTTILAKFATAEPMCVGEACECVGRS